MSGKQANCRWAVSAVLLAIMAGAFASADTPPAVSPQKMAAHIDEVLARRWRAEEIRPAAEADDAEFMRRIYLDLTGKIPTVGQARKFLDDTAPDKRARLIDRLQGRPGHATHLANTWNDFLIPDSATLRRYGGANQFYLWLTDKFTENAPYDEVVRELLLAEGAFNQSGPLLYYFALEGKPEELAANSARSFLGVKIECAQCHDHPYDHWTQRDFWGYAAFFAQLERPNPRQPFATQVRDTDTGDVKLPDTDEVVPPKFLSGDVAKKIDGTTRRQQLARWLTSADNPYFARAAVNRVWAHMFGRGLVDPVDDLGDHNSPSQPQLLDELAEYFVESGFDLRGLVKTLALTRAYQLSSISIAGEPEHPELFARAAIKTLTAEQLYDCLAQATARRQTSSVNQNRSNVSRRSTRQAFLNKFRAPGASPTDYQNGIPQALTLMNGRDVRDATDLEQSDILVALTAPFFNDEQRVETLFLATLSRRPSDRERAKFVAYVTEKQGTSAKRKALGDILWALLNSAEFTLNH